MIIYAVVVTYNRLNLLPNCVESIKQQTYAPNKIVIVNNGSTDGTKDYLDNLEDVIVLHQENVGGAGGFQCGIKYSFDSGADWIWVMDDDIFPEVDCLENLLKYTSISMCLQPTRFYSDGIKKSINKLYSLNDNKFYFGKENASIEKDLIYVNTACFEGMFINRNLINNVGFPDSRFFISGDDTIYGYLISRFTNIFIVSTAKMTRAKKSNDDILSPMYLYYFFRNFHLIKEYHKTILNSNSYPFKNILQYILNIFKYDFSVFVDPRYTFFKKIEIQYYIYKGVRDCFLKKTHKSI